MRERLTTLLKINLADLLLEAEDPRDAVEHFLAEMDGGVAQAKDAVASAVAQRRQLERQLQRAQAGDAEWDAKTDEALRTGDEARARDALRRKLAYEAAVDELGGALRRQEGVIAEMKTTLRALQTKADDVRRRRIVVMARHARVEAEDQVRRAAEKGAQAAEQEALRADLLAAAREVERTGLEARLARAREDLQPAGGGEGTAP